MKIHESAEDYLEAILLISEEHGTVHSIEVAAHLGVSKPSVSVAMKRLRENGYILMDENKHIILTSEGETIAQRVLGRHRLLTSFLMRLGVSEQAAREDACKIEHDLSDESFAAIKRHVEMHS